MSKSTEEQVYTAFSDAINSGDLAGAFQYATDDISFRPIGGHPELGREFKGMQDILENCWMKVFQHIDQNGVAITVNDIVTADGIAFVQFNGTAKGRSGMTYDNIAFVKGLAAPSSGGSSAVDDPTGIPVLPLWALFGLAGLIGLMGLRRKA